MAIELTEQLNTIGKYSRDEECSRRILLMTDVEKGLLTGIFDGEGCIVIYVQHVGTGKYPIYACYLFVANTSKALIDNCRAMTGVGITRIHCLADGKRQTVYQWKVAKTKDVLDLLKVMYPFLQAKKRQAAIAFELVSTFGRNKLVTLELNARRAKLYEEMQSLLHPRKIKLGEFGGSPERIIPSQASVEEGVETSPEITDISAQHESDDIVRATQECVEVEWI